MRVNVRSLLVILIVFMTMATLIVKVVDSRSEAYMGTLSLQGDSPTHTPLFKIQDTSDARYLRTAVANEYDGTNWKLMKLAGQYVNKNTGAEDDGLPLCITQPSQSYLDYNRDVLNDIPTIDDPTYLTLHDSISDRVIKLAQQITAERTTPFEKAKAIEVYLRVKYKYSLDYAHAPENCEPNDWFLFEEKEGMCGNFNSAFVILTRAAGIPSRLAVGYVVKPNMEEQIVYSDQAHAWAEVGFQGLGWLTFEAVPP